MLMQVLENLDYTGVQELFDHSYSWLSFREGGILFRDSYSV